MCVSKVQHVTGRKTGCNRSRPVFFGFSIFRQTSQLATEKIQKLCNRNRWSGLLRLGSVRFRSFFQSSELDLRTLVVPFLVPCYNFCKFLSHSFCIWDFCILSSSFHPCLTVFLKLFWKLIVGFIILIPILSSSKMNRNCLFLQKEVKSTDCEHFSATLLWSFL